MGSHLRSLQPMRYVAIDLGDKRTGLAVGDSVTGLVSPLEVLEVPLAGDGGGSLLKAISNAIVEQMGPAGRGRGGLVIGLPLNMDGTEGPAAKRIREFGVRLAEATGRAVAYQDERLTSADADWATSQSGLTRGQKKARRDALAASAILRDFLAALTPRPGNEPGPKES